MNGKLQIRLPRNRRTRNCELSANFAVRLSIRRFALVTKRQPRTASQLYSAAACHSTGESTLNSYPNAQCSCKFELLLRWRIGNSELLPKFTVRLPIRSICPRTVSQYHSAVTSSNHHSISELSIAYCHPISQCGGQFEVLLWRRNGNCELSASFTERLLIWSIALMTKLQLWTVSHFRRVTANFMFRSRDRLGIGRCDPTSQCLFELDDSPCGRIRNSDPEVLILYYRYYMYLTECYRSATCQLVWKYTFRCEWNVS